MKRIFFLIIVLILVTGAVFAQQQTQPREQQTAGQIRQNAQQTVTRTRETADEFEAALEDLRMRNNNNHDLSIYLRIRGELEALETMINNERFNIEARLDRDVRVSNDVMTRLERMIEQYRAKTVEMEVFANS